MQELPPIVKWDSVCLGIEESWVTSSNGVTMALLRVQGSLEIGFFSPWASTSLTGIW